MADTRYMEQSSILKPQDVALLVKVISMPNEDWRQLDLALGLQLSQGEVAKSLGRLSKAHLINGKKPNYAAALEFLVHAIKYVFPIEPGPLSYGVPTGISAPAHKKMVVSNGDDVYVWPSISGKVRGQSIEPLYPKLAEAALQDSVFYGLMSAVEILRVGRAREKKLAENFLAKELSHA